MTTPKEAYEMRKAARQHFAAQGRELDQGTQELQILDMLDRFVTAVERIADTLEAGRIG